MAREIKRLNAVALQKLARTPGRHADGGGLYLFVKESGASWIFRYRDRRTQKLRDMGLGPLAILPLADARSRALEARRLLLDGTDPIDQKKEVREAARTKHNNRRTFGDCALACIEAKRPEWRSEKHAAQWRRTLETDAASIWDKPVDSVGLREVLNVLEPIWAEKTETASRVRQRIEAVLDWATVRKLRTGDNPARWRGHLDALLAKPSKVNKKTHHAAIPHEEVGRILREVRSRTSISARLLETVILTACRVGEAAGARWNEFDLEVGIWTCPPERMKAARAHVVPLPAKLVSMLRALPQAGDFVFPGVRGKPLVPDSARALLQREIGRSETVHGFRSSFRDWAAEQTNFPREVAEAALAHTLSDKTEAAYRRTTMLGKRRELMEHWAAYLDNPPAGAGNVIPIRAQESLP